MNPDADPLQQLRDIHLPAEPGLWPPAPGWWLLAALLIAALAWLVVILCRRRRNSRSMRAYLAQLASIPEQDPDGIRHISVLTRQFAVARFGRDRVASLQGEEWLAFLDCSGQCDDAFRTGPGRALADAPYRRSSDGDSRQLRILLTQWAQRAQREA